MLGAWIVGLTVCGVAALGLKHYYTNRRARRILGTRHQLVFQSSITRLSSDAVENMMKQHSEEGDSILVIVDPSTVYILKQ